MGVMGVFGAMGVFGVMGAIMLGVTDAVLGVGVSVWGEDRLLASCGAGKGISLCATLLPPRRPSHTTWRKSVV